MAEINPNISWNTRLEAYFAQTGEKAHALAWLHKKSQERYSNMKNYTDLPVIVLGVLNGATSIGSTSLFGDSPYASVGVGIIALITAILSTISSYFKWAARAEAHKIASIQYSKLYRFLNVQCSLPRDERMKPSDLLKYTKDEYDRMVEIAPLVPPEIIAVFKYTFNKPKYKDISWPEETNGLEAITIYKEIDETLFPSGKVDTSDSDSEDDDKGPPKKQKSPQASNILQILEPTQLDSLPLQSITSMFNGGKLSPTLGKVVQRSPIVTGVSSFQPPPEDVTLYVPDEADMTISTTAAVGLGNSLGPSAPPCEGNNTKS